MSNFKITCESTIDLPYSYTVERNVPVIFYSYAVDGEEFPDDMGREADSLEKFYKNIENGKIPTTSQINVNRYMDFFEEQLKDGKDILHIAFDSKLTASIGNALLAIELLKEKYSQRIVLVDSLCASSGYGLLVDKALDLRDEGKNFDEIIDWIENNKTRVQHHFYSSTLKYFQRTGRVSGPIATIGTILHICPMMRVDLEGKLIAYDKVRGTKKAIQGIVKKMIETTNDGENYSGKCFISNSNCIEEAEEIKSVIKETFKNIKSVEIFNIGTIIASHTGPGTVAVFFWGDERAE